LIVRRVRAAERSGTPGYSGTPLAAKLGIKPGSRVMLVHAPSDYRGLLEPLPEGVRFGNRLTDATDIVHLFSRERAELGRLLKACRGKLKATGAVWVSWPKKSANVPTDIVEDTIRELALPLGFVDVKVCAVSAIWSGLKLVVRRELR
jgi:hypothetical protein